MISEQQGSKNSSAHLSSVSEISRDFNNSDMDKEWESKSQYRLLTPTPSPGVTPGNSPSSISQSSVFLDFQKKEGQSSGATGKGGNGGKKKTPSVVRWVCETETETDSDVEGKNLLKNPQSNRKMSLENRDYRKTGNNLKETRNDKKGVSYICNTKQAVVGLPEGPSVIITPSNSPQMSRAASTPGFYYLGGMKESELRNNTKCGAGDCVKGILGNDEIRLGTKCHNNGDRKDVQTLLTRHNVKISSV
jgi:hypothetical protein